MPCQTAVKMRINRSAHWPQLVEIAAFLRSAHSFAFGSGLAIVHFLYSGVVIENKWVTER